jgi:hypothetical protein
VSGASSFTPKLFDMGMPVCDWTNFAMTVCEPEHRGRQIRLGRTAA